MRTSALTKRISESFVSRFGESLKVLPEFRGETTWVVELGILVEVLTALKVEERFNYLVDICSVDNFGEDPRFEIVYHLFSYDTGCELRLKAPVAEDQEVPSVVKLWKTANWHEREVFDMMGIRFSGHPDLRRILMWDGYPYHPLRKDFPLEGKVTEIPDVAFTAPAPLEGGPFVTSPQDHAYSREPRARPAETLSQTRN